MNIYFFTETGSGCYKWRAGIPAKYLRQRGHQVQVYERGAGGGSDAPDVMVFFRTYAVDVTNLLEWCKKRRILVVYDTDDALDLIPATNHNYHSISQAWGRAEYMLSRADIVTTTTPTLAEHLKQWNPNVVVLPNSVDPDEWKVNPREVFRGKDARVGWSGSSTHFVDLAVALDALADLQKKRGFTFVIQGITGASSIQDPYDGALARYGKNFRDSPVGRSMKRFLDKLGRLRYESHPSVPVDQHAGRVCSLSLDIGIAPLTDEPFNQNKSCIKYYEYAMSGAVTLASQVVPYSMEVPVTAKNSHRHWTQKMEELLDTDRQTAWKQERDWVLTNRNMQRNVELWESVYQCAAVLAESGRTSPQPYEAISS